MRSTAVLALSLFAVLLVLAAPLDARGRRGGRKPPPVDPELAKVVDPLVEKLDDASYEARETATLTLMEMGPVARPALAAAKDHPSPEVRARVGRILLHYREIERQRGLAPSSADDWPTLKRGPGRRGSSGLQAVRKRPDVKWFRSLEEPMGLPYFDSPMLATASRLYVVSRTGQVTALERSSGEVVWEKRTGEPVLASPVLAGETLYIPGRSLTAMDVRFGKVRWKWATDYGVSAPPLVVGGRVYSVEKGEKLVSLNPLNGDVEWTRRLPATASTPVEAGDLIVVGTSEGIWAVTRETGSRRWVHETRFPVGASPAVLEDRIVFGDVGRHLTAITIDKGKQIWQRRIPEGSLRVAPVVYGDVVLLSTTGGTFRAFRSGNGSDLWMRSVGSFLQSSPCVGGELTYFMGGTRLHAMYCSSGDDAWRINMMGRFSAPILVDGTLYTISVDGTVVAFE